MNDEQHEIRRVNWTEVFSFPQIFKSFRMAINLSSLGLSLVAIILVFAIGWVMDGMSGSAGFRVQPGEIGSFVQAPAAAFDELKAKWEKGRLAGAAKLLAELKAERYFLNEYSRELGAARAASRYLKEEFDKKLREYNKEQEKPYTSVSSEKILEDAQKNNEDWPDLLAECGDLLCQIEEKVETLLDGLKGVAADQLDKDTNLKDKAKDQAKEDLGRHWSRAHRLLTDMKLTYARKIRNVRGGTVFASLRDYEAGCVKKAISAVVRGNLIGGMDAYRAMTAARRARAAVAAPVNLPSPPTGGAAAADKPGFFYWALMSVHGFKWMLCEHWLYSVIFLPLALVICAIFGGAVNRIAALHFAREQKISIVQALRFSLGKFFSFLSAPLIPLAFIFAAGGLVVLGGFALGNWGGGIVMGLLFFLALIVGLIIAFLLVGLVAGAGLMYPTIAVEGSDSFDAMSRSFSYVLNRPWRAGFYGLVALVYGSFCYLFVRLFAYLALVSTHEFATWGIFVGGDRLAEGADRMDIIWARPTFDSLLGPFNWSAMSGAEQVTAFILGIWVFLVAAAVMAFLLSFAASSTTIIYYLLRQKVDATDLDDVYVEEPEEDQLPAEEPAEGDQALAEEQTGGEEAAEEPKKED